MILNTLPKAGAYRSYTPNLLHIYLIEESSLKRVSHRGFAGRFNEEGLTEMVQRSRFNVESPMEKVQRRRSDGKYLTEKTRRRRLAGEGLLNKVR